MDIKSIDLILQNLESDLHKYEFIVSQVHNTDLSSNKEFQKAFNGFFKMRQRSQEFYTLYFSLFESLKTQSPDFSTIIKTLYCETNRVEASFSSKMLATIDPTYPILDKFVLQNFGLKLPYPSSKNRIEKTISVYDDIINRYQSFMGTSECTELLQKFDAQFPNSTISDIKKIDFVLWKLR